MSGADRVYDRLAQSYGYDVDADTASRLKPVLITQNIAETDRVLDVGCGNGIHLARAADRCESITGLDANAAMLREALAKKSELGIAAATLVRGDASRLPFTDACYDVVYCFSTLQIVPDMRAALFEMARVMRSGGVLIVDVAGRFNLAHLAWRRWYRRQGHRGFSVSSYRQLGLDLRRAGFEVLSMDAIGVTDQWRYLPVIRHSRWLTALFHEKTLLDRDYRISNRRALRGAASRWYVVARRVSETA